MKYDLTPACRLTLPGVGPLRSVAVAPPVDVMIGALGTTLATAVDASTPKVTVTVAPLVDNVGPAVMSVK